MVKSKDDMPDESTGAVSPGAEPEVSMDQLPTKDEFKRKFKAALDSGLNLSSVLGVSTTTKVLDPGKVWGAGQKFNTWQMKDALCRNIKNSLKKGFSADLAIKLSLDALPGEGVVHGFNFEGTKKDKPEYRVEVDCEDEKLPSRA